MSELAPLSTREKRRFLSACAAALPPLILTIAVAAIPTGHHGFLRPAYGLFVTLTVCSGPLMFVPIPCLVPAFGMGAIFAWLWRVRGGAMGDWGWKVHLTISAMYVFGMFGIYAAIAEVF